MLLSEMGLTVPGAKQHCSTQRCTLSPHKGPDCQVQLDQHTCPTRMPATSIQHQLWVSQPTKVNASHAHVGMLAYNADQSVCCTGASHRSSAMHHCHAVHTSKDVQHLLLLQRPAATALLEQGSLLDVTACGAVNTAPCSHQTAAATMSTVH